MTILQSLMPLFDEILIGTDAYCWYIRNGTLVVSADKQHHESIQSVLARCSVPKDIDIEIVEVR